MPPWTPGRIQDRLPLQPPAVPHARRNLPLGRHRPHVLRAASAFRSPPQGGFREPRDFRLSELFDWLHVVPPSRRVASLSVIDAPKKNTGEIRGLPCGVVLGSLRLSLAFRGAATLGPGCPRSPAWECAPPTARPRAGRTRALPQLGRRDVRDCGWLFSGLLRYVGIAPFSVR